MFQLGTEESKVKKVARVWIILLLQDSHTYYRRSSDDLAAAQLRREGRVCGIFFCVRAR